MLSHVHCISWNTIHYWYSTTDKKGIKNILCTEHLYLGKVPEFLGQGMNEVLNVRLNGFLRLMCPVVTAANNSLFQSQGYSAV